MMEVSMGGCVIIGDFNHGHIQPVQWKSLESAGVTTISFYF